MPRYSKYNDAINYSKRLSNLSFEYFTPKAFNDLIDAIKETSGYKMITWDSWGNRLTQKDAIAKIHVKGEWE